MCRKHVSLSFFIVQFNYGFAMTYGELSKNQSKKKAALTLDNSSKSTCNARYVTLQSTTKKQVKPYHTEQWRKQTHDSLQDWQKD